MQRTSEIWHRRRCCGIEKPSAPRQAPFLILCSHHIFQPEISSCAVPFILAGARCDHVGCHRFAGAHAQQPMQRVQVGILECRGGASVGFIVGSVTNLGCVLRVDGMPEDRYVATIRKVGLDLGITQEIGAGLGRVRAGRAARARRSLGQLRRRAGQRLVRRRGRRQRAGRRLEQFDRAAAAQRAGPGRPQRRGRDWKAWNFGREGKALSTSLRASESDEAIQLSFVA